MGGSRAPSLPAYYVALAGILLLLLLLCCYLIYFCVSKVNELSKSESLMQPHNHSQRPNQPYQPYQSYPVQPAVRAGATALARLCGPTAGPALDTHSGSEPTLSTDASEAGPTLEPTQMTVACDSGPTLEPSNTKSSQEQR